MRSIPYNGLQQKTPVHGPVLPRRFTASHVRLNPESADADAALLLPDAPYHILGPILGSVAMAMGNSTVNHWSMAWPFLMAPITVPCGPLATVVLGRKDAANGWCRPILCWAAVVAPSGSGKCAAGTACPWPRVGVRAGTSAPCTRCCKQASAPY